MRESRSWVLIAALIAFAVCIPMTLLWLFPQSAIAWLTLVWFLIFGIALLLHPKHRVRRTGGILVLAGTSVLSAPYISANFELGNLSKLAIVLGGQPSIGVFLVCCGTALIPLSIWYESSTDDRFATRWWAFSICLMIVMAGIPAGVGAHSGKTSAEQVPGTGIVSAPGDRAIAIQGSENMILLGDNSTIALNQMQLITDADIQRVFLAHVEAYSNYRFELADSADLRNRTERVLVGIRSALDRATTSTTALAKKAIAEAKTSGSTDALREFLIAEEAKCESHPTLLDNAIVEEAAMLAYLRFDLVEAERLLLKLLESNPNDDDIRDRISIVKRHMSMNPSPSEELPPSLPTVSGLNVEGDTSCFGSPLVLTVEILPSDVELFNFQWFFEEVPIPGATTPIHALPVFLRHNCGCYQLRMTAKAGGSIRWSLKHCIDPPMP